jgi:hypothetical protein
MLVALGFTGGLPNDFALFETSVPGINIAIQTIQSGKFSRKMQMDLSGKNVANGMTLDP